MTANAQLNHVRPAGLEIIAKRPTRTSKVARLGPYATAYEITDRMPFIAEKLKELRRKVKPEGPNAATVFMTRVAGAPTMLIGHPVR
ncbi:hypothetical protein [Streptomyces sp. NPDC017230]|uniref:THUMP-like domain-containing protein n=1 Tax=unclassified Streptomyces TaxID=2593676 RepID=UPI0037B9F621